MKLTTPLIVIGIVTALIGIYFSGLVPGFRYDTENGILEVEVLTSTNTDFPIGSGWFINLDEPITIFYPATTVSTGHLTNMNIKMSVNGAWEGMLYYCDSYLVDGLKNNFASATVGLTEHTILMDYSTGEGQYGVELFVLYQN
jgi:hypothetical protein